MKKGNTDRSVYIVDGSRTPFLRARGDPGKFSASELALKSAQPLMLRQHFAAEELDEVILGCIMPAANEANIARVVSLRLGCGNQVPAWTVQRNCGSGMQAVDTAFRAITDGHADLILAGGSEAMSQAPMMLNKQMVTWLSGLSQTKSLSQRVKLLTKFRPVYLKPIIALLLGLTDPVVGLSMGKTAEILAHRFGISREDMDAYAVRSHLRLAAAQQQALLDEIEVIYDHNGNAYAADDGVRPNSDMASLAKLKPVFDKPHGKITAGNSAQITDGASWLLLASEKAVTEHQLTPIGRIVGCTWIGLDPKKMGLGPVYATSQLLKTHRLKLSDIDRWEINEAFATQVLACIKAMADKTFCKIELSRRREMGEIDPEQLNINGGSIALGHPVGASGARIVLHLLKSMQQDQSHRGIASLCIGGGQGGAMLLESVHE